jgi:hypothetical protein
VELLATDGAVPDITPVELFNVIPVGNVPDTKPYVIGASPVAANVTLTAVNSSTVANNPALVVQAGMPEYCMPGILIAVPPSALITYIVYPPAAITGLINVSILELTNVTSDTGIPLTNIVAPAEKPDPFKVIVWPPATSAAVSSPT